MTETGYFSTKSNGVLFHVFYDGRAMCNRNFRPRLEPRSDLGYVTYTQDELTDAAEICARCVTKNAALQRTRQFNLDRQHAMALEEDAQRTATVKAATVGTTEAIIAHRDDWSEKAAPSVAEVFRQAAALWLFEAARNELDRLNRCQPYGQVPDGVRAYSAAINSANVVHDCELRCDGDANPCGEWALLWLAEFVK